MSGQKPNSKSNFFSVEPPGTSNVIAGKVKEIPEQKSRLLSEAPSNPRVHQADVEENLEEQAPRLRSSL